jgi:hypothetical protein
VKTTVNAQGVYARQEHRPGRFRTTFRFAQYEGEPWFVSRFLSVENTDSRTWLCQSYFHYPISFIGGKAEDDRAGADGSALFWRDEATGALYGAVIDRTKLRGQFWKDAPDGAGEHPDIWRELKQELRPGQIITASKEDGEVLLFGARSTGAVATSEPLQRLRTLAQVHTQLVGGGP